MKCVKCGFEKESDKFELCEKCGAVQSKSIKFLEGKKIEACEKIDRILIDLKKLNEEFVALKDEIKNDVEYDSQTKEEIIKNVSEAMLNIEKTASSLTNLKKHVAIFVVDYEINGKLKKAHEYIVSHENEYLEYRKKFVAIGTRPAKHGVLLSNNAIADDFTRPEKNASDYNKIEDIEFSLSITKYPALAMLSMIYKVLAYLVILFSLLGALSVLFVKAPAVGNIGFGFVGKIGACLATLLSGGIIGLTFLAISESIKVLMDLECNSRAIKEYTRALFLAKK